MGYQFSQSGLKAYKEFITIIYVVYVCSDCLLYRFSELSQSHEILRVSLQEKESLIKTLETDLLQAHDLVKSKGMNGIISSNKYTSSYVGNTYIQSSTLSEALSVSTAGLAAAVGVDIEQGAFGYNIRPSSTGSSVVLSQLDARTPYVSRSS